MKTLNLFLILILFFLLSKATNSQWEQPVLTGIYDSREIEYYKSYIEGRLDTNRLNNLTYMQEVENFISSKGATIKKIWYDIPLGGIDVILSDTSDAIDMTNIFLNSGLFMDMHPLSTFKISNNPSLPNDTYFTSQWYLRQTTNDVDIDANKAWWLTKGSSNVRIYIIDTGVRLVNGNIYHEDLLNGGVIRGRDYLNGINNVTDSLGHGTAVAGLIKATHNTAGVAGLSPGVELCIHKIAKDYNTNINLDSLVRAINNAVQFKQSNSSRPVVINLSLGGNTTSNALENIIATCRTFNITVVSASGNDGIQQVDYPGRYATTYENVISVGSTNRYGDRSSFSNYGAFGTHQLTLVAPGGAGGSNTYDNMTVCWTAPSNQTSQSIYNPNAWGTSFSTALVSGAVGIMLSINGNLTPSQIKDKISNSCDKVSGQGPYSSYTGFGQLNAFKAATLAMDVLTGSISEFSLYGYKRITGNSTFPSNTTINLPSNTKIVLDSLANLSSAGGTIVNANSVGENFITRRGSTVSTSIEIVASNGGCLIPEGNFNFDNGSTMGCIAAINGGSILFSEDANIEYSGGMISIDTNSLVIFDENAKVTFKNNTSGSGTFVRIRGGGNNFYMSKNSSIIFKQNSRFGIENRDTAKAIFYPVDGQLWNGIVIDTTFSNDTIRNCVFNGASSYITINNNSSSSRYKKVLLSNTFNDGSVVINNSTAALIQGNYFNSPNNTNSLLQITHNTLLNPREWTLNILYNTFIGGSFQMRLSGYSGNVTPYYIYGNILTGGNSNTRLGLWGNNISGTFKNNSYTDNNFTVAFDLLNSSMDLYGNIMKSNANSSLWLGSNTTANLAPVTNGSGQLVWYGGFNKLTTDNNNLIYFQSGSNILLNLGNNCLTENNTSYYHVLGNYQSPCFNPLVYMTKNKWNTIPPSVSLTCDGWQTVLAEYEPYLQSCPSNPNEVFVALTPQITSMGEDVYDTLYVTEGYEGEGDNHIGGGGYSSNKMSVQTFIGSEDGFLYYEILNKRRLKNYTGSINECKALIDNFDTSKYVLSAINSLYSNYQSLDTSNNPVHINILYDELKTYLNNKIQQYQNNVIFVHKAYQYFLKCLVKTRKFSEAISGYENIMVNHPDPIVRLTASWERSGIILLMNGRGGGKMESDDKLLFFDKNPIHKIYSDKLSNMKKEKEELVEKLIMKFNPHTYSELDEKIKYDMGVLLSVNSKNEKKDGIIPSAFELYQNYPNPFNPASVIKYDIPKDVKVSIKIYDILGKEITALVNEFKQAGRYTIEFNGQNYSSGVYFYRMEAGDFVQSKKMVLVK